MATLRHKTVGAHSGMSLFLCTPSPSVCLFSFNMGLLFFTYALLCPNTDETISLCFLTPPSPCGLVYPSHYLSLFCLLYMAHCLSLCLSRNVSARVVESWQSHLSCGVPRCQACQMAAYLPVSHNDKSGQLVQRDIIVLYCARHCPLFVCLHLTSNPHQTKVSLPEVLPFRRV